MTAKAFCKQCGTTEDYPARDRPRGWPPGWVLVKVMDPKAPASHLIPGIFCSTACLTVGMGIVDGFVARATATAILPSELVLKYQDGPDPAMWQIAGAFGTVLAELEAMRAAHASAMRMIKTLAAQLDLRPGTPGGSGDPRPEEAL